MENYTVQTEEELALNELNPLKMEICIQQGFLSKFAVRLFFTRHLTVFRRFDAQLPGPDCLILKVKSVRVRSVSLRLA